VTVKGFLGGSTTKTDTANILCRWVSGEWKVEPFIKSGFLGFGTPNLQAKP
jgi:hypothetical protein